MESPRGGCECRIKTVTRRLQTLVFIAGTRLLKWMEVKVKVKCTLVQALRLCTDRTARRGSTGIALLFLDHDTRRA